MLLWFCAATRWTEWICTCQTRLPDNGAPSGQELTSVLSRRLQFAIAHHGGMSDFDDVNAAQA